MGCRRLAGPWVFDPRRPTAVHRIQIPGRVDFATPS
ncbi:hypothetical protein [Caudoviricetes sp.]|nr:hypothetical protein [Caudoviricetes sp.]